MGWLDMREVRLRNGQMGSSAYPNTLVPGCVEHEHCQVLVNAVRGDVKFWFKWTVTRLIETSYA